MCWIKKFLAIEISGLHRVSTNTALMSGQVYACRRCATPLFRPGDVKHPSEELSTNKDRCTSVFLENCPEWLEASGNEGYVKCKCQGKLGMYKWSGAQCSCGTWITPAWKFQKARVEQKNIELQGVSVAMPNVSRDGDQTVSQSDERDKKT